MFGKKVPKYTPTPTHKADDGVVPDGWCCYYWMCTRNDLRTRYVYDNNNVDVRFEIYFILFFIQFALTICLRRRRSRRRRRWRRRSPDVVSKPPRRRRGFASSGTWRHRRPRACFHGGGRRLRGPASVRASRHAFGICEFSCSARCKMTQPRRGERYF